jgi:hypothetical protein
MKIISTKIHSYLDYITGISFLAAPMLLTFQDSPAAIWTLMAAGGVILSMSIFTNYEGGLIREVPISVHLNADIITGLLLAASPWIFGFSDHIYLPHLILGLFEFAAAILTSRNAFPAAESAHDKHMDTKF